MDVTREEVDSRLHATRACPATRRRAHATHTSSYKGGGDPAQGPRHPHEQQHLQHLPQREELLVALRLRACAHLLTFVCACARVVSLVQTVAAQLLFFEKLFLQCRTLA